MEPTNRRAVLKGAALSAFAFTVGGADVWLSLREAHAQGVSLKVLTPPEREAFEWPYDLSKNYARFYKLTCVY